MPRYRFRLQRVLDAKHCAEDRKKQDLAVAQRTLDREERVLLHLHSRGEQCRREALERPQGKLDVLQEVLERARFTRLMKDIDRQAATVEDSISAVSRERDDLLKCSKERKVLEALKERGLVEWMREWLRREQVEQDEIGRRTTRRKLQGTDG